MDRYNEWSIFICQDRYDSILKHVQDSLEGCSPRVRPRRGAAIQAITDVVKKALIIAVTNFVKSEQREGETTLVDHAQRELTELVKRKTRGYYTDGTERLPYEVEDVLQVTDTGRRHLDDLNYATSQANTRMAWAHYQAIRELIADWANFRAIKRACATKRQLATAELGELMGIPEFAQKLNDSDTYLKEIKVNREKSQFEFVFNIRKAVETKQTSQRNSIGTLFIIVFVIVIIIAAGIMIYAYWLKGSEEQTEIKTVARNPKYDDEPRPPTPMLRKKVISEETEVETHGRKRTNELVVHFNPKSTSEFAQMDAIDGII